MNIGIDVPEESFDDFALPEDTGEIASPEPLSFAPWHKPRKQFVRQRQWVHHARMTIKNLKNEGHLDANSPVRYLTLPGPDLLDVKLMADVCADQKVGLHYTGFCYVRETEAVRLRRNTQQFELDRGAQILPGSGVHISRLEEITKAKSEAKTLMERGGPYSIVNIDACEPIANVDGNQTGRLVDAIRTILDYQLNANRQPWLLYLTTPVQIDSVSEDAQRSLYDQVRQNVAADTEFADELAGRYADGEDIDQYLVRVSQENGHEFVRTITLGVSKWLVHLAEQANFNVKKLPAVCYSMFRREPYLPNMISTCYLFSPRQIPIVDNTGLTPNAQPQTGQPPISDHIRALRKSIEIENIDETISNDLVLRKSLVDETKALLSAVGYDVDHPVRGYDIWLSGEPMEPTD
ncbi:hypothetical protein Q4577_23200 [Marinovum sp. 2_MG-2023]|uniref:PP_RS20740 family protein n=1 Tax=unclassified Marinovum TaxID=2647166 RepID=UPI0026E460F0|nr:MULTISPECIES: hypothetical protein [unclassified Marinovum]MDO6732922.1 hypothetical protein [Marinovum sp. 2_MG-2023]MDO6782198.1 hypothetical protein [Marinovum sp. 1_MG-2023]